MPLMAVLQPPAFCVTSPSDERNESECAMNLETVSYKHLHELQRLPGELLVVIRQAILLDELITEAIRMLQHQAGEVRRSRFDAANRDYLGY